METVETKLPRTIQCKKDESLLRLIPGGAFISGPSFEEQERSLDSYYLGIVPVTNAQYLRFVEETGHDEPKGKFWANAGLNLDHPVMGVTWSDAKAYCGWAGLRLPRQLEWEKGARGTDGRRFPWGDKFDETKMHYLFYPNGLDKPLTTVSVWEFKAGCSPYGLFQMVGNGWEWCEDGPDLPKQEYNDFALLQFGTYSEWPFHVFRGERVLNTDDYACGPHSSYYLGERRALTRSGFRCAVDPVMVSMDPDVFQIQLSPIVQRFVDSLET